MVFGINGAVGFGAHILTAAIIDNLGGYGAMYVFVGVLTALALVIVALTPFPNYRDQSA